MIIYARSPVGVVSWLRFPQRHFQFQSLHPPEHMEDTSTSCEHAQWGQRAISCENRHAQKECCQFVRTIQSPSNERVDHFAAQVYYLYQHWENLQINDLFFVGPETRVNATTTFGAHLVGFQKTDAHIFPDVQVVDL